MNPMIILLIVGGLGGVLLLRKKSGVWVPVYDEDGNPLPKKALWTGSDSEIPKFFSYDENGIFIMPSGEMIKQSYLTVEIVPGTPGPTLVKT